MEKAKVYFTKEITPESLVRIYEALGRELHGKIAVKISTGEPGGHNFLQPDLIAPLVKKLRGYDCRVQYGLPRTAQHLKGPLADLSGARFCSHRSL